VTFVKIVRGPTTYFISDKKVPSSEQLPWHDAECDAFVAILQPEELTDRIATDLSAGLLTLRTDWIETMGNKSEWLHDFIDKMSVTSGRQHSVGDGDPMTAWHADMVDLESMIEYVRLGGLGASENKLVLVIGPESILSQVGDRLKGTADLELIKGSTPNGSRQ
jgi:hypothetical protein